MQSIVVPIVFYLLFVSCDCLCSDAAISLLPFSLNSSTISTYSIPANTCSPLITDFTSGASLCPDSVLLEAWITTQLANSTSGQLALLGGLLAASTKGTPDVQQPPGWSLPTASPFTVSLTNQATASSGYQQGRIYQSLQLQTTNSRLLFVSLLNLNLFLSLTFTLRTSCVNASDPIPCPSLSPGSPACSSSQQGTCTSGSCSCLNGYGGFACAQKISVIQNGAPAYFPLPGSTWKFFSIDLLGQDSHNGNILVELTQPSGTSNALQPLLVVTPINATSWAQGYTPDLINIPSSFLTTRNMSPDNWLSPWSLSFYSESSSNLTRYWSVGIFNSAPLSKALAMSNANLTLRVRASPAMTAGQSPPPLCPLDCSGNGACSYPQFVGNPTTVLACSGNGICLHQGTQQQNFNCQCSNGYYGSICQSAFAPALPLSSGQQATLGPFSSFPGSLDFFQFVLLTSQTSGRRKLPGDVNPSRRLLQNPSYSTFTFKFSLMTDVAPPPSSFLAAIQITSSSSAIPLNFSSDGIISMLFTSQATYSDNVFVAVYNNDMLQASRVNFTINASWTGSSASSPNQEFSFTNEWQYGIMVGAWGLFLASICIGSCYALVRRRLLIMRMRSGSRGGVSIEMGGAQPDAQERRRARNQRQLMVQTIVSKQLLDTLIPASPYAPPAAEGASVVKQKEETTAGGQEGEEGEKYEEDICTVCIEKYKEGEAARKLFCNHTFHADCVDPWLLKNGSCPVCRQDIVAFPDSPQPQWALMATTAPLSPTVTVNQGTT